MKANRYSPESFADESILGQIDKERAEAKRADHNQAVKVLEGQEWLVRFLPTQWTSRNVFWAKYSQHWINKRPYFCAAGVPPVDPLSDSGDSSAVGSGAGAVSPPY